MKLRTPPAGLIAQDGRTGPWVHLPNEGGLLELLAEGEPARARTRAVLAAGGQCADPETAELPLRRHPDRAPDARAQAGR
jgi:hypothetical protein